MTDTALEVLYVDNHLLAVNKPAGLVTQVSPHHPESLETRAAAWIKREFAKPGNAFAQAVHRLDRPVSGVVLFARTSKALSRLNEAIRSGRWEKTYWAVVSSPPPQPSGTLAAHLVHDDFRARAASTGTEGAKPAVLHYRTLTAAAGLVLLEVDLDTGRYHQIRAQFAACGCPIVGDGKYGSTVTMPADAIGLHHRRLRIDHPVQKTEQTFTAPAPATWPWTSLPLPA